MASVFANQAELSIFLFGKWELMGAGTALLLAADIGLVLQFEWSAGEALEECPFSPRAATAGEAIVAFVEVLMGALRPGPEDHSWSWTGRRLDTGESDVYTLLFPEDRVSRAFGSLVPLLMSELFQDKGSQANGSNPHVYAREHQDVETSPMVSPRWVGQPSPCSSECPDYEVFEVWEVQRRPTVFGAGWQAPFLPHDGPLRARWVNREGYEHYWLDLGKLQQFRLAPEPPIAATPDGELLEWHLSTEGSNVDRDGWQYRNFWCDQSELWFPTAAMRHLRRRRWVASAETALAGASARF